jgi:hypothetical protein
MAARRLRRLGLPTLPPSALVQPQRDQNGASNVTFAALIVAAAAALAALWSSLQATRSANAARRAIRIAEQHAQLDAERRREEIAVAAESSSRETANLDVVLEVAPQPQLGMAALVIHNQGPHVAAGIRVRARLVYEGTNISVGEDNGWPFMTRQEKVDDINLPADRSISLVLMDFGPAPAVGEAKRTLTYELLYRDKTGAHRLNGVFCYGLVATDRWGALGTSDSEATRT